MLTNKKTLLSTSNLIFNWLQILVWNYVKPKMKFTFKLKLSNSIHVKEHIKIIASYFVRFDATQFDLQ